LVQDLSWHGLSEEAEFFFTPPTPLLANAEDQEHRMTDDTTTQDSAAMPPASDGSVSEPVAWVAFATDASESRAVCLTRQEAETVSRKHGWGVAPLYAVRLTDAEREVLGNVADDARYRALAYTERVVRGLLERLK
jgi:hypothetical protein